MRGGIVLPFICDAVVLNLFSIADLSIRENKNSNTWLGIEVSHWLPIEIPNRKSGARYLDRNKGGGTKQNKKIDPMAAIEGQ